MWRVVWVSWDALPNDRRTTLRAEVDAALADVEGDGWVVVDECCPCLDAATLRTVLEHASSGRPVLGVRPVTDTVKRVRDGVVAGTVDREGLVQVASPLVVPAAYGEPAGGPLPQLAAALGDVERLEVPAAARRLVDGDDLPLL